MVKMLRVFLLLPLSLFFLFVIGSNSFASYEMVYDEARLFSEEERAQINKEAMLVGERTALDIVILTINDSRGKPSSQYALDFYNENGFGYQGTLDGLLYLINMDEREVYIFTRDRGTDYIDSERVERLLDLVYPSLGEEKYSESVQIFLAEVEKMMETGLPAPPSVDYSGESGSSHYDEGVSTNEPSTMNKLGIYFLISIIIGGISVAIMALGNRGRSTVNARTYLEDNSFRLTRKSDRHYNTIVTQQKIQTHNNNSGGGSFGGGSGGGGGGIGGGGRKF